MPIKILMPALSPTMTEGTLASWQKKEGDEVTAGDVIAEIETDKATMEVEAVDEGVMGRILIPEGTEGVPVNEVIALLLEEGEDAKQTIPHFYLTIDAEIDALLAARKQINESAPEGVKVSVNDIIIKAAALALKKVPAANASYTESAILLYDRVDIAVAVATDNGLITPIIKDASNKGLAEISSEMKDLAGRARQGKLKPEEFQGGTFSVSNLGMFGIKAFDAVINPPQGCILAVGAGAQQPVVRNGELAVATVMSSTLSVDHRVVDGAVGAEFLAAYKVIIENPFSMML